MPVYGYSLSSQVWEFSSESTNLLYLHIEEDLWPGVNILKGCGGEGGGRWRGRGKEHIIEYSGTDSP